MPSSPRTVLITGCSAHGIGAALALGLAQQGHFIFATARSTAKVPRTLASLANVQVLPLDVTDPTTIAAVLRAVTEHGHGLDILVNNAGTGDLLISSKGRIINMSSVGAVVNTPWIGVYSSSKAAVAQLSETLRLELAPLGVSVVCLMIGTITTAFHANEPEVVLLPTSRYAAVRQTISDWATGRAGPKGCSADEFAASIVDDVLGRVEDSDEWIFR
ncbi:hypothetical protein BDV32DRAFT_146508 [Aspergillus pseudonomiae]|nr:hypothetical protein BDV32DRAFT_146508 [Aspergillus pseudonomiae]